MINLVSTTPSNNSDGHYLDDNIYLQFDQEIESSYLTSDYFTLWRTDEEQSTFHEQIALAISVSDTDPNVVIVNPTTNLSSDEHYLLIVLGGASGIQSVGGDTLDENETLFFETGSTVRPDTESTAAIEGVDLHIDGYDPSSTIDQSSRDVFSTSGASASIGLVRTIPEDMSVGVENLSQVIFVYNDDVYDNVSATVLTGRYSNLPFDMDPFADRTIQSSGVVVTDHSVAFDIPDLTDTENTEYVFKLPSYNVRGVGREGYDQDNHVIKFMGPLSPLYATPDQINMRLRGYNENARVSVTDYDLYKLIHEVSTWVRDELEISPDTTTLHRLNRLVICLVLKELLYMGLVTAGGGIKSRSLLLTEVVYENLGIEDIAKALDECIADATPAESALSTVRVGIKSGKWLGRGSQGKYYGVYR